MMGDDLLLRVDDALKLFLSQHPQVEEDLAERGRSTPFFFFIDGLQHLIDA
ncbi:MAG: hypothetical protein HKP27_04085 [Myxococcales bacterium]|nr:hypothetical protein [Myxococcales bacterium]